MYARLNIWLKDSDDFTFTPAEKQESLNTAIDDPHVYINTRDTSLTVIVSTPSYPLPSGWTGLHNVAVDFYGDGTDINLDRSSWKLVDGNIYFRRDKVLNLPVGKSLILYGKKKLSSFDIIPNFLQEYVLNMAASNTLSLLRAAKTNRFIRNETTMGEMLQAGAQYQGRAQMLKRSLHPTTSERL
jgi:hypothetical protein